MKPKLQNFNRKALVENKWLTLYEDKYSLPNGSDCTYYHAKQNDAVMAIAVEKVGSQLSTYIVNQYRHPIAQSIWQFPMGGFDPEVTNPAAAARTELIEEVGLTVGEVKTVGTFFSNPGFTNQRVHVCVTSDILKKAPPKLEESEYGLTARRVLVQDVAGMVSSNEMGDSWGITGLHYLNLFTAQ